ncbi:flagellar basal body-associated protein FliL [Azomonas macrocytogenes]|uniref:Flagellar protein FliL n=1 Tax=Azomonas macrocytogenes TaxID=69962 RepID=A0A839T4I0_AZOMA|nr:flagellar basal body-associated protein FliL [Azomonas macrocytogenes]MBB3102623.1 flagellar FliL protein [Azomonas macrocytogenes]
MRCWIVLLCLVAGAFVVQAEEEAAKGQANKVSYVSLFPALVGNYGTGPKLQYYKADVALQVTGEEPAKQVKYHEPLIRNQLVMLFSQQTEDTLGSIEAKERLRQQALKQVQAILTQEEGKPLVDDLLFNNLIVQ